MSTVLPALEAVTASGGTAEAAAALKQDTGGKTGTSEDQKTAQFVGFTPELVTAVSMYQLDENGNPVSLTNIGGLGQFHGGDWPVTVWMRYMKQATANLDSDRSKYGCCGLRGRRSESGRRQVVSGAP